jgi:hypothetical protein
VTIEPLSVELVQALIMLVVMSFGTSLVIERFYIPERIKPIFLLVLGLFYGQILRMIYLSH